MVITNQGNSQVDVNDMTIFMKIPFIHMVKFPFTLNQFLQKIEICFEIVGMGNILKSEIE